MRSSLAAVLALSSAVLAAAAPLLPGAIPVTTSSEPARTLFLSGRELIEAQRWASARKTLAEAIAADPQFAQALAYLGRATPGRPGELLLEEAAQKSAALPEAERLLVEEMLAERHGDRDRARNLLLRMAQLAPHDWRAQYRLGLGEAAESHFPAAEAALRRAIALEPTAAVPHNILGFILAKQGLLTAQPRLLEEGIAETRRLVTLAPREPNPLDSLGEVLLLAGRLDEAEQSFLAALALDRTFWIAWTGVAESRLLRGEWSSGRAAIAQGRAIAGTAERLLQLDVFRAWSFLAEGDSREALRSVEALAAQAREHGEVFAEAFLLTQRARMEIELGHFAEGLAGAEAAYKLSSDARLAGAERASLRKRALLARTMADARLLRLDEAGKALGLLLDEQHQAPLAADLRSAVHFARGEIAFFGGNPRRAVMEYAACDVDDQYCRYRGIAALEAAGDLGSARAERQRFLAAMVRDPIYQGVEPWYLYARGRLLAEDRARVR